MRIRTLAILALVTAGAVAAGLHLSGRSPGALFQEIASKGPAAVLGTGAPETARGKGGGGPVAGPPPEVTTSQPVTRPVTLWDEYTGRFDAVETVDVRSRVSGYLTKVHVNDGQDVAAGDKLFTIDPRPYARAVAQARAELELAKVRVANAKLDVERGRPLLDRKVISEKTFDDRENVVREGEAQVLVAENRVATAELDLAYTEITAPIAGRLGRTVVTLGNWIGGGSGSTPTLVNTIVRQDPIHLYFDLSELDALKYKRLMAARAGTGTPSLLSIPVGFGLPDEQGYPHTGRLDFVDNRLDDATGTLRVRAVVENRRGLFSPGMFARVRLSGEGATTATLLPDEAIGTDLSNRFVYVIDEEGTARRQTVALGPLAEGMRVIRDGLKGDEWVVVRGIQKVRPGMKVKANRTQLKVSDAAQQAPDALRSAPATGKQ